MERTTEKKTVLILDPHTIMREGLKSMIHSQEWCEVPVATSSTDEALRWMSERRPDLVIMDPELEDADGVTLSREILRQYPNLPILLVGRDAVYDRIVDALKAGVRGYAVKESSLSELRSGTIRVLEGAYFLDGRATEAVVNRLVRQQTPPEQVGDERYASLTGREKDIFRLLAEGRANPEIAERLGISTKTVSNHRGKLMKKLRLRNYPELLRHACRIGIVDPDPWERR